MRLKLSDMETTQSFPEDPLRTMFSSPIRIEDYTDPAPQGRRIAPRFPVELEIIILTQTKSFRTQSINVSSSGALLKDPLPEEFMKANLDIIIVRTKGSSKRRLLFRGTAVGGPLRSSRITFEACVKDADEELKEAFQDLEPLPFVA